MAIRVCWGHMEPLFLGGRGGRRGSAMAPFERAMVVSYRLYIVTFALSVTIRPQFAIECLQHSNQQWWVTLGQNLGVLPLEQTRHVGVAKSERPGLTNGEIIFEEFQLMWSQFTNVTDGRTDRETTCDRGSVPFRRNPIRRNANPNPNPNFGESGFGETGRHRDRNTALCTKVHRAVKSVLLLWASPPRIDLCNRLWYWYWYFLVCF